MSKKRDATPMLPFGKKISPWLAAKIAARSKPKRRACGCSSNCCTAGRYRCRCRCHGANHGAKRLRTNPAEPRLHVTRLGRALELRYVHTRDGRGYKHSFGRGVAVTYTKDGKHLVIGPVHIKDFIEG